ncbi:MAG: TIGR03936 family radical SAM-associated protein [Anaerolineae bacterium]
MQANYVQRLRLTFSKTGPTRFIGHLDLARTLERALNRARIPVAYTQGFNQRPRMQMAAALPLGFTSECEMADIWLMETMEPEQVQQQLMSKMALGITVHRVEVVELKGPTLQTLTQESAYTVTLLDPVDTAVLQQKIAGLLAADTLVRERGHGKKRKEYDLCPLIYALHLVPNSDPVRLEMRLAMEEGKNGRPDEVLRELGLDPLAARIHRTAIVLNE